MPHPPATHGHHRSFLAGSSEMRPPCSTWCLQSGGGVSADAARHNSCDDGHPHDASALCDECSMPCSREMLRLVYPSSRSHWPLFWAAHASAACVNRDEASAPGRCVCLMRIGCHVRVDDDRQGGRWRPLECASPGPVAAVRACQMCMNVPTVLSLHAGCGLTSADSAQAVEATALLQLTHLPAGMWRVGASAVDALLLCAVAAGLALPPKFLMEAGPPCPRVLHTACAVGNLG
jgi:hypothetical protein